MPRTCPILELTHQVRTKHARRKEARPGELLQAALELFVEKGFAATRAEEVAKRAGVSKGTLFLYFASKEELFKAVVRENISGRFAQWDSELASFQGSTADMMRYSMQSWWERIGSTKAAGITKLIMSEAHNFPELCAFYQAEVIRPGHELIAKILQRGIQRGEFRPMDVQYAIYTVLAPIIFLATWQTSFGTECTPDCAIDPKRYMDTQLATILHGLCVPSPAKESV